jgi:hypothetical protein
MIPNPSEEPVVVDLLTPPPRDIEPQYIVSDNDDDPYV